MTSHGCVDGTLDDSTYSSPVPIIGLYVAAASLFCLAMMLSDIVVAGFFAMKPWLPCKWFRLNSLTLTLLSVVSKLPVDLTSPMPSRQDQLSKLTGTAAICISMGFLAPSLGLKSESECFTNMLALSIFVITVAVNICFQLYTGVISLFFTEHIIILGLMLLLLLMLWNISSNIKTHKRSATDQCNNLLRRGNPSIFERLKLCCVYTYCSNVQFKISTEPTNAAVCCMCLICSMVVIEATFRSLILKKVEFCVGVSDYGWSMPLIVITQILTVAVGTVAVIFRWLSLFRRMEFENILNSWVPDDTKIQRNRTLKDGTILLRLKNFIADVNIIVQFLTVGPFVVMRKFLDLYKEDGLECFDAHENDELNSAGEYVVHKAINDIYQWMEFSNMEAPRQLLRCLSKASGERVVGMEIKDPYTIKVTSLSLALLVRIAQVSIPKHYADYILPAFKEAKEIVHFIDQTIQPKTSDDIERLSYAKALWRGGDFTCLLPSEIIAKDPPDNDIDTAIAIITHFDKTLPPDIFWYQLGDIIYLIKHTHLSFEELCDSIEQLFVDMLHALFSQLPVAIFKSLRESPAEEFEDRLWRSMKFLFQVGGTLKHLPIMESLKEIGVTSFAQDPPPMLKGRSSKFNTVVLRELMQDDADIKYSWKTRLMSLV